MSKPIVSLCMPTNGIIEWVFPVLDSIYEQGCDDSAFEVVITDNGNNKEFKNRIREYINGKNNIVYVETDALPFLNEIESYKRASGELIKFVNHRTKLVSGALQRLIDYANLNVDEKPITYFSNGVLKLEKRKYELQTFDHFVRLLSYWSSWSTGMTIWKEDFDKLPDDVSSFNELFPHTDILFAERKRSKYVIDNTIIFDELPVNGIPKARYDLFYAFSVEYVSIILKLLLDGNISTDTFLIVKEDNLGFVCKLYLDFVLRKMPCSYDLTSFDRSIKVFYSKSECVRKIFNKVMKKIVRR